MASLNAALAGVGRQLDSQRGQAAADSVSARKAAAPMPAPAPAPTSYVDSDDEASDAGGGGPADDSPILVYCRIRPPLRGTAAGKSMLAVDAESKKVEFNLSRADADSAHNTINNSREQFKFSFNGLFPEDTTQAQMFEGVAVRVLENVTAGYNGTIFAYGQTGSGKTHTLMGGTKSYEDRGIIPRAITWLFDWIAANSAELSVTLRISYLEIYNDKGYDLLDPNHDTVRSLEELPRVVLMETESGAIHFKNLMELPAANVDEALNLLFVGDTNRVVCETPSNDASTRSHCIFMIGLEMREHASSKVRHAKLNLVDLAGSERVKKTGVGGKILTEALAINVSLHYLEQVIVALHEAHAKGGRAFIPYRNSMLTSVLRDSLGGNCKTVMVATLSSERSHIDESISTSRFAARVGLIKNRALLNEELDPYVLLAQLKLKMRELKDELAIARGVANAAFKPLEPSERLECQRLVEGFVRDDRDKEWFDESRTGTFDALPMPNPYRVRACFEIWKTKLLAAAGGTAGAGGTAANVAQPASASSAPASTDRATAAELARLQLENAALIAAVGIPQAHAILESLAQKQQHRKGSGTARGSSSGAGPMSPQAKAASKASSSSAAAAAAASSSVAAAAAVPAVPVGPPAPTAAELALAQARAEAFESFRRSYRKHALIEQQKEAHQSKCEEARRIGESINATRERINATKARIEAHRLARGVAALTSSSGSSSVDPTAAPLSPDSTELHLRSTIDSAKALYHSEFTALKALKSEIDFLKRMVEQSRASLKDEFERWWAVQQTQTTGGPAAAAAGAVVSPRTQQQPQPQQQAQSRSNRGEPQLYPPSQQQHAPRMMADAASVATAPSRAPPPARSSAAPTQAWAAQPASQPAVAPTGAGGTVLHTTGNSAADADIARFYQLKQEMMRQRQQQQQQ